MRRFILPLGGADSELIMILWPRDISREAP